MAVLPIVKAGAPVLKEQAQPVKKIDRKIKQLLDDMAQTMYDADGVGLAAPQVGVSLQVVVIDTGEGLIELINPEILERSGSELAAEGCLSVPGLYGDVERAQQVVVEALNRQGKKIHYEATGLLARAFQHEIDHLRGVLFIEIAQSIYKNQQSQESDGVS